MFKDTLYNRLFNIWTLLNRKRNYLHKLYKFHNVAYYISEGRDFNFEFDSQYGKANIIMYEDKNIIFKYYGKIEFELELTKDMECDYFQDHRIRELELYLYSIFGVPRIYSEWEKLWFRIKKLILSRIGL